MYKIFINFLLQLILDKIYLNKIKNKSKFKKLIIKIITNIFFLKILIKNKSF